MMDDQLSSVVQAYREENTANRLDAAAVRRRVMASHRRKPSRRLWFAWLLPATVLFLGSAALAANGTARYRLAGVFEWLDRATTSAGVRANRPLRNQGNARAEPAIPPVPIPTERSASRVAVAKETPAVTAPSDRREHPPATRERTTRVAVPASARRKAMVSQPVPRAESAATADPPASSRPPPDADLSLYRAAHLLHFRDKDPALALAAWDAYLAAFPQGKLAIEAQFNRTLCLVKLGRTAEAETWLEKFASGAFGSYRRTRAADLLDVLRRR